MDIVRLHSGAHCDKNGILSMIILLQQYWEWL